MDGLVIETINGYCPVQGEGTIDGVPFYFRSRGKRWTMGIGGDVVAEPDWHVGAAYGEWPEAGWMPESVAQAIIEKCCELWRVSKFDPAAHKTDA
jgi:hypothetical protein